MHKAMPYLVVAAISAGILYAAINTTSGNKFFLKNMPTGA